MNEKILLIDLNNYLSRSYHVHNRYGDEGDVLESVRKSRILFDRIGDLEKKGIYKKVFLCYDSKTGKDNNGKILNDIIDKYNLKNQKQYKEGRVKNPKITEFIKIMKNMFFFKGFTLVSSPLYEADDVIATYASESNKRGYDVHILSNDKDLYQVINEKTFIIGSLKEDDLGIVGINECSHYLEKETGIPNLNPKDIIWIKAVLGDKSDGILGVNGIGPAKLRKDYMDKGNNFFNTDIYKNNESYINELMKVITLNTSIKSNELTFQKEDNNKEKFDNYCIKIGFKKGKSSEIKMR